LLQFATSCYNLPQFTAKSTFAAPQIIAYSPQFAAISRNLPQFIAILQQFFRGAKAVFAGLTA
jgi:hypothetical protein